MGLEPPIIVNGTLNKYKNRYTNIIDTSLTNID